jgi:hypothetical protein
MTNYQKFRIAGWIIFGFVVAWIGLTIYLGYFSKITYFVIFSGVILLTSLITTRDIHK